MSVRRMSVISLLWFALAVMAVSGRQDENHSVKPETGFVPNEETAIRIAEAVWIPIYGKSNLARKKPFHARLSNGVWYVSGSLPRGMKGGVPIAEISKQDGRILRVSHGK